MHEKDHQCLNTTADEFIRHTEEGVNLMGIGLSPSTHSSCSLWEDTWFRGRRCSRPASDVEHMTALSNQCTLFSCAVIGSGVTMCSKPDQSEWRSSFQLEMLQRRLFLLVVKEKAPGAAESYLVPMRWVSLQMRLKAEGEWRDRNKRVPESP